MKLQLIFESVSAGKIASLRQGNPDLSTYYTKSLFLHKAGPSFGLLESQNYRRKRA